MTERQDKEKCGEHLLTPYTINNWSALNIEFFNALLTHYGTAKLLTIPNASKNIKNDSHIPKKY